MYKPVKITENIYWVGVNDRRTHLFENIWPLDKGVSYNAYFIKGNKNVLIDTVEASRFDDLAEKLSFLTGPGEKIDYLVINHLEPDHSGAIRAVTCRYPGIRIVGNSKTFGILNQFYQIKENLISIEDGLTLDLGNRQLKFFLTPMLHWPETMMTYDTKDRILFSGDAFGSFGCLDGGIFDDEVNPDQYQDEIRRYYSNIVGKYWNPLQRAIKSLSGTEIRIVAPAHGPVWRNNPGHIMELYSRWSRFEAGKGVVIVYGSMYGHTAKMAEHIARTLTEAGIRDICIYDSSRTHVSYIISDIFKYRGVILGSSAYNGTLFPPMDAVLNKIINTGVKDRYLGIFGSAAWGGGGVKGIELFAEKTGWEVVAEPVQAKGAASAEDMEKCGIIAQNMAKLLN
jgi:flavorubredoxin